ncbi:MAG: DUF2235 domain-containing protein [Smithella sp.]
MAKNIVLCSDGTGNQDIKNRGTNVFKIYEAVDTEGHKTGLLPQQIAFYDEGVGTSRVPLIKLIGGAFGYGFSKNVRRLYRDLSNVYEDGDNIYLFGFSRGAYTVRALAGFIQYCEKIPRAADYEEQDRLTKEIKYNWSAFKRKEFRRCLWSLLQITWLKIRGEKIDKKPWDKANEKENEELLKFIGVWDSVGAIGVPIKELRDILSIIYPISFKDNSLGPGVGIARHALSIDEERLTFAPILWDEKNEPNEPDRKRIKQVWFAGVHSNVGGGYPKQGMSLVSLDWMMNEAKNAGLRFINSDRLFVRRHQDVHSALYDSRSGFALYYRWNPRNISKLCEYSNVTNPTIHISVLERIAYGTDGYAPGNIPYKFEIDTTSSIKSWPSEKIEDVRNKIRKKRSKVKNCSSPLEEMKCTILSGKASYWAFVLLSISFAIRILLNPPKFLTLLIYYLSGVKFEIPTEFIEKLYGMELLVPILSFLSEISMAKAVLLSIVAGLIINLWSTKFVDSRLEENYRNYWRKERKFLREKLTGTGIRCHY